MRLQTKLPYKIEMKQLMKNSSIKPSRRRQSGAALITALMVSVATAMLLGASLTVALTNPKLGHRQADSQSAIELANAGINSELQFIALNTGNANILNRSSQPNIVSGLAATLLGSSTSVLGRQGTVTGYTGGNFYVYSSNNASGTIPWDGITSPFYVTSTANVGKCWHQVQIQAQSTSLFNVYGIFATGSYTNAPTAVTVAASASVNLTGSAGSNGTCSKGSGCSFQCPNAINSNCGAHSSGQFDSTCVKSGGSICSVQAPLIYPKTSDCVRTCFGCSSSTSDSSAWNTCSNNCNGNTSGCYHYKSNANSATINTSNCTQLGSNIWWWSWLGGVGNQLNGSCWSNCNNKPGTNGKVQTLIFEPGDYYFTSVQLAYDATNEMIIDPCAYASGGTPGQVRFWVYDPSSSTDGNPSDYVQCPITNTCASGTTTPDPGQFRLYYGKDGCTCTFTRPSGCKDYNGNTVSGDFNYYCGIYACTKQCTDTSSSVGTCIGFCGTSSSSTGCANLCGSMLCDKLNFQGNCNCNYIQSQTCTKDPCSGGKVLSWSCNG